MSSKKPVLVVMAAGMGSRYGGLKQLDPVGKNGEIIMDYSVFDAKRAGFQKVVFVIRKDFEELFREKIGDKIAKELEVNYVFQSIDACLPAGYSIPEGRTKPWGTGHAVLCCKDSVDGPFAVINADDYYGRNAFQVLYDRLAEATDRDGVSDFCMVGFHLDNTLTDNGSVSRGICRTDETGKLVNITERTKVIRTPEGPAYLAEDGETWVHLPKDNLVSMNMWGFTPSIFAELETGFERFLKNDVVERPEKAEYYIPFVAADMMKQGKATVEVLSSSDRWYGVTYKEDKPDVVRAMAEMTEQGLYPERLF